jgi:Ca2+-transporting ATPase
MGNGQRILWHTRSPEELELELGTDLRQGLTSAQAERKLLEIGPNELIERGLKNPLRILFEQFTDAMVIVLLVAAVISFFVKDPKDASVILAIVILNAVLGFIQEYRAERAMAALKRMAAPRVKVRRNGHLETLEARQLVPGDLIQLEAGDAVPADARLIEAVSLRAEEASLTGESLPVEKHVETLNLEEIPIGDRQNMLFMGTAITYGRGTAVVVGTGMCSELGRIAELIQSVGSEPTPLQRRMAGLGRALALAALVIVAIVFGLGVLRGGELSEMFFTAIALAVAAVPEGLPAVVTISLALGAQRMLRRQALIRKLPAVETLGSVTVICSDKTGTLTENRMTVKVLDVAEHTIHLEDIQARRDGMPIYRDEDRLEDPFWKAQAILMTGAALCNDAEFKANPEVEGDYTTVGDPTEGALLVAAARYGFWKEELEQAMPRVAEIPFSSERKRMTTLHDLKDNQELPDLKGAICLGCDLARVSVVSFTKGAVDALLGKASQVWVEGVLHPLDSNWQGRIARANDQLAQEGLRVLGIGMQWLESLPGDVDLDRVEQDMIFVGMVAMMDPPRPEVLEAVDDSIRAGIRPVMITGDHPLTALRIARDLRITEQGRILTGAELSGMSQEELDSCVQEVSVYARVSPEHKLRIVESLQRQEHIVAMTGDGVNDAPALQRADIGVAMGITGTDVAKEAADMIVLDDNFASIVRAVREGRTIFDNLRKFIQYTLTSNTGEILVMLLAPLIGMPLPLTALQILWINLVTDGLPGLALGLEPPERNIMRRPPLPPKEGVLSRGTPLRILWIGGLMGLTSLGLGYWAWSVGNPYWQTMLFTTLTVSQMGNAMAIRSRYDSLFKIGIRSNMAMLGAVILTLVLQALITYIPQLQGLVGIQPLPVGELVLSLGISSIVFIAIEIEKWVIRRR